jgi:hypothetical protein
LARLRDAKFVLPCVREVNQKAGAPKDPGSVRPY